MPRYHEKLDKVTIKSSLSNISDISDSKKQPMNTHKTSVQSHGSLKMEKWKLEETVKIW